MAVVAKTGTSSARILGRFGGPARSKCTAFHKQPASAPQGGAPLKLRAHSTFVRISNKSSKRRIISSRNATSANAAEPCELQAPATVLSLVNTLRTVAQKTASAIFKFLTMPGHDGTTFDKRLRMSAAAVPLFASTGMNNTLPLITSAVASFIRLYLLLLFVRVLLTWFPNVNWMGQPWITLRQVTDPYLNLFRNLIPPIMGQIDFTPILGFLVLQFLAQVLGTDDIYSTF